MCKQAFKLLLIPLLLFYVIPVNANEKEEKAWSEELVYYIVVDRYNNGNPHNDGKDVDPQNPSAYHGGDIVGIMKKLDYIKDMGFSSIVLSPIFAAGDYAGEHVEDVKKVEEHFGSLDDLNRLVDEAHKREIKVLIEFVANHVEMNQQETIDTANWWIEKSKIDGYYINKADSINTEFWQEFQTELEKKNENFYLIGSLEDNQEKTMSTYLQSGFDSILNEHFFEESSQMFSKVDQSFEKVTKVVEHSSDSLSTFIDNNNTVRFTRKAIENQQHPGNRLKMAFSYMYTVPGTPVVYYGSEIAIDGGKPPENRPLMNFQSDDELIDYIGKLAKIRKSLPALTKGDYQVLYEKSGMIIFKRSYQDETIIIVINNTSASQKINIPAAEIANNKELQGLLTGNTFQEENGEYEFIIDRELAEVYEIKDKKGLNIPLVSVFILVPSLFILFLIVAKKRGQRNNA
jgi:glycosidase